MPQVPCARAARRIEKAPPEDPLETSGGKLVCRNDKGGQKGKKRRKIDGKRPLLRFAAMMPGPECRRSTEAQPSLSLSAAASVTAVTDSPARRSGIGSMTMPFLRSSKCRCEPAALRFLPQARCAAPDRPGRPERQAACSDGRSRFRSRFHGRSR